MGILFGKKEDPAVKCSRKLKLLFTVHWRGIACLMTPLLFLPLIAPPPTKPYSIVAYALCVMAVFWVLEAIPLPVTAFIPIALFPVAHIVAGNVVCQLYINDAIFVFLGSLILACAIEQSGLHNRMALCAIRVIGYSHYKLLFAMSFMTMFVSMWMTNTAATTMVVPINFALLKVFEDQKLLKIYETSESGDQFASDITTCYFCSATFSATIGGVGTLIGTATNLVFKGLLESSYPDVPEYLSFPMFSAFSIPYMLLMEITLYLSMVFVYFGFLRPGSKAAKGAKISPEGKKAAKDSVMKQTKDIGTISFWEIMVTLLFCFGIALFFTRSPQMFPGWADKLVDFYQEKNKKYIKDPAVAMSVAFLMWWLPRSLSAFKSCTAKTIDQLPKGKVKSVLDWNHMDELLPWSFMFLLGGGFAISGAAAKKYSDLNGVIGDFMSKMSALPSSVLVLVLIILTIFLTNLASNVAVATVIVPIGMTLATRIGANPMLYNMASGLAASFCYMLPVGTPGNLVVQSSAKVPTKKMMMAGALPTIFTILLTWGALLVWAPVIWPDIKKGPNKLIWTQTAKL